MSDQHWDEAPAAAHEPAVGAPPAADESAAGGPSAGDVGAPGGQDLDQESGGQDSGGQESEAQESGGQDGVQDGVAVQAGEPAGGLREALAEAERQRDEYLDHLRRERAEFDNFRKRTTKERMDALDRGAEQLVAGMLGVLDNLALALDAAEASADDRLAKGVQMVASELLGTLQKAGLDEVPGVGEPFDPTFHEAMLQVPAEEPVAEPLVAEVLRRGYRFKGRVLRPAAVKVLR